MSGMSLLPWAGVDINAPLRPLPHTPIWRDTEKCRYGRLELSAAFFNFFV